MKEYQENKADIENENLTLETEIKPLSGGSSFLDILMKIRKICCFVPIVTTIVFILYLILGRKWGNTSISLIIAAIGWVAALIAAPIKIISLPFKGIAWGWNLWAFDPITLYGIAFHLLIKMLLAWLGLAVTTYCIVCAPAIITIYHYITDLR